MSDFGSSSLDYIRFVLSSLGIKPTELARMAGLSSTTITRPLNDKSHKFSVSMGTLEKIQTATGYEFAPFLTKEMDAVARTLDAFDNVSDYMLTDTFYDATTNDGRNGTPVLGIAQVGAWIEERFMQPPGHFLLVRHPSDRVQRQCVILEVKGNNLNRLVMPGEMLFCHLEDATLPPPPLGSIVIIERADKARRIFEISAKVVSVGANGEIAFADASYDPAFVKPDRMNEAVDETVRVVARALFVMRFPSLDLPEPKGKYTKSA